MDKRRLERIEEYVLSLFRSRGTARLLAREIFEGSPEYANADLVRAFADLEKRWRLLLRHTTEGDDWVSLTPEGAAAAGLETPTPAEAPEALPHPPKSAT
jgi:hypothetical protein